MKIQINSLEVIERLIGGDSKLEIDIRNSIVQSFSKKYLKPLVNDMSGNKLKEIIQLAINDELYERKSYSLSLKPEYAEKLRQEAKYLVEVELVKVINEEFKKQMDKDYLNRLIERQVAHVTKEYIKQGVLDHIKNSLK